MKLPGGAFSLIGGLAGLAIMTMLVAGEGYEAILQTLAQAGWGLLWIIPFHFLAVLLDVEGWRTLLRPRDPGGYATRRFLLWVALVREAVSRLLPFVSIGGEIVGIRLILLRPLEGAAVAASVVVEVLLTLINQLLFAAVGVAMLVAVVRQAPEAGALMGGLAMSLPIPVALAVLLQYGSPFTRIAILAERLLGSPESLARLLGGAATLDDEIRQLCTRRTRLGAALVWQLAGMLVGSFETWFVLDLFGRPTAVWNSIILESLTLAVRNLVFFVPGALGVQESALLVIGAMVGVSADAAIALSLAKRFREIAVGLPALASWQWIEVRRIHRHFARASPAPPIEPATSAPPAPRF